MPVDLPQRTFSVRDVDFLCPLLLAALLLFGNLHRGDLAGFDDAVYAHEARVMLQTGDWLNVSLNGRLDFDKPPLFLWLTTLSLRVFGISDFAVKFPAALLGLGTILLVYGIARELTAERWIAYSAMLVLASTQYFLKYATHSMTDVPFTFFFTLAVWAYLRALRQAPAWLYVCGAAIGAGILIRSVLGLLVIGVIVSHLVVIKRFDLLRTKAWWIGAMLAGGLPLIWFGPQFYWYGTRFLALHFSFTKDNLDSIHPSERHWLSGLGHYPFLLLKLYWPWWPVMCAGVVLAVRRVWRERESAAWLLLLWVIVAVVPFSLIENKVLRYILPAFPAFALLSAYALHHWIPVARRLLCLRTGYALLGLAWVLTTVFPGHRLRAEQLRPLAVKAEAYTQPEQRILLYANGKTRWDYVHQILWYADRNCDPVTDLNYIQQQLDDNTEDTVVIMDRRAYAESFAAEAFALEVIDASAEFVCFRKAPVQVVNQPDQSQEIAR